MRPGSPLALRSIWPWKLASAVDISTSRLVPTSVTKAVFVAGLIATQHVAFWPSTAPLPLTEAVPCPLRLSTAPPKEASVTKRSFDPGMVDDPKRTAVPLGDDVIACWLTAPP